MVQCQANTVATCDCQRSPCMTHRPDRQTRRFECADKEDSQRKQAGKENREILNAPVCAGMRRYASVYLCVLGVYFRSLVAFLAVRN